MSVKFILLSVVFFGAIHQALAQDSNKKLVPHSISSIGVLNGSNSTSLALQTIFGVGYGRSFAGLGVGLDYYRYRSIPVFVDVRHEFGKDKNSVYLYGDVGYNYDWVIREKTEQSVNYKLENRFSGGWYYDAGAGYKIGFNKSNALLLSAGYTFKKLTSKVGSGMCPIVGPCYDPIETYRYYLSRLVIKAGWRF